MLCDNLPIMKGTYDTVKQTRGALFFSTLISQICISAGLSTIPLMSGGCCSVNEPFSRLLWIRVLMLVCAKHHV